MGLFSLPWPRLLRPPQMTLCRGLWGVIINNNKQLLLAPVEEVQLNPGTLFSCYSSEWVSRVTFFALLSYFKVWTKKVILTETVYFPYHFMFSHHLLSVQKQIPKKKKEKEKTIGCSPFSCNYSWMMIKVFPFSKQTSVGHQQQPPCRLGHCLASLGRWCVRTGVDTSVNAASRSRSLARSFSAAAAAGVALAEVESKFVPAVHHYAGGEAARPIVGQWPCQRVFLAAFGRPGCCIRALFWPEPTLYSVLCRFDFEQLPFPSEGTMCQQEQQEASYLKSWGSGVCQLNTD